MEYFLICIIIFSVHHAQVNAKTVVHTPIVRLNVVNRVNHVVKSAIGDVSINNARNYALNYATVNRVKSRAN